METQQTTKPEIRTYDYGIFSIDVCQRCFSYKFNHDPDLVFHGINAEHLDSHQSPILTPMGDSDAPFYYQYLKKRWLHLGPLSIVGLDSKCNTRIWFGFHIRNFTDLEIRHLNYHIWDDLHFHANAHPKNERSKMEKKLFLSKYSLDILTEILVGKINCNLAEYCIARTSKVLERAQQFAGKNLKSTLFNPDYSQKLWDDYLLHLERSDKEWKRFLHEPRYYFSKCDCNI